VDLSWYWKYSSSDPDSHLIATIPGNTTGEDSLYWDMSTLDSSDYYVYCIADDGLNRVKHGARGVLILNREPGFEFTEPDGEDDEIDVGRDFATEVLNDEWDMSSEDDIDIVVGFDSQSINWENGIFHGVTTVDPAWSWQMSALAPVDADLYKTASFRLYLDDPQDAPMQMMIFWKYTPTGDWEHTGFITAAPGWHTYVVDLGGAYPSTWTGDIRHFRIDPVTQSGVTVELDWVRLTVPGSSTYTLTWNDSDPDDNAEIGLRSYIGSWEGDELTLATGLEEDDESDFLTWDVSPYPAGAYFLKSIIDDRINAPEEVSCPHLLSIGSVEPQPVDLESETVAPDTLLLSWGPPAGVVDEYRIYRSSSPLFVLHPSYLIDQTQEEFYRAYLGPSAQNPDLNYFFRVAWVDLQGVESPGSNAVGNIDLLIDVPG